MEKPMLLYETTKVLNRLHILVVGCLDIRIVYHLIKKLVVPSEQLSSVIV